MFDSLADRDSVALLAASQVALYYTLRYVISSIDSGPSSSSSAKKSRQKGASLLSQSGLSESQLEALELDEYESTIAGEIIPPTSIDVTFESIGGLDEIIASLRETVIYPLCYPELFSSKNGLLSAPKGVLLYGHPGCGKTMLAKALAKESGATFINLPLSSLSVLSHFISLPSIADVVGPTSGLANQISWLLGFSRWPAKSSRPS